MPTIYSLGAILVAYIIGSIPNGLLIARAKGVNIRTVGSKNIGATNVFRSVSKTAGITTFFCDFLKGFLPAFLFPILIEMASGYTDPQRLIALSCGVAAILGHNWSIFLRFTGGKGVATSTGFLLAIAPGAMGIGLAGWILLLVATGYVSVASMGAGLVVTTFGWYRYTQNDSPLSIAVMLSILCALVILRHHANIKRLLNGSENKFKFGKKKTATSV